MWRLAAERRQERRRVVVRRLHVVDRHEQRHARAATSRNHSCSAVWKRARRSAGSSSSAGAARLARAGRAASATAARAGGVRPCRAGAPVPGTHPSRARPPAQPPPRRAPASLARPPCRSTAPRSRAATPSSCSSRVLPIPGRSFDHHLGTLAGERARDALLDPIALVAAPDQRVRSTGSSRRRARCAPGSRPPIAVSCSMTAAALARTRQRIEAQQRQHQRVERGRDLRRERRRRRRRASARASSRSSNCRAG